MKYQSSTWSTTSCAISCWQEWITCWRRFWSHRLMILRPTCTWKDLAGRQLWCSSSLKADFTLRLYPVHLSMYSLNQTPSWCSTSSRDYRTKTYLLEMLLREPFIGMVAIMRTKIQFSKYKVRGPKSDRSASDSVTTTFRSFQRDFKILRPYTIHKRNKTRELSTRNILKQVVIHNNMIFQH